MTHADVAVIGAGPAGLAAAKALRGAGARVCVFDKGRGAGGRLSSRRLEGQTVDHGAPFFRVGSPEFQATVARWADLGLCAPWPDAGEDRWVGTPRMNAPIRAEADDAGALFNTQISSLTRADGRWSLGTATTPPLATAETVLITCPARQALDLVAAHSPSLSQTLKGVQVLPVWVAAFQMPAPAAPSVTRPDNDAIVDLIVCDSRKPGRASEDLWVVHATTDWSRAHVDASRDYVMETLGTALWKSLPGATAAPVPLFSHRWLYGRQAFNRPAPVVSDTAAGLFLAGDGPAASNSDNAVESAWMSGEGAAANIVLGPRD